MTDGLTPEPSGRVRGRRSKRGQSGKSGRPPGRRRNKIAIAAAATIATVVDTFVGAIETSDFERRLQLVEADCSNDPDAVGGMYGAGPGDRFNL